MERSTWIAAHGIVSPLGYSSAENFDNVLAGNSGIRQVDEPALAPTPFFASRLQSEETSSEMTHLEEMVVRAVASVLQDSPVAASKTAFILSTTKGNISFLEEGQPDHPRIHLPALAQFIASKFGFKSSLVVSNACISGVMALLVGRRMIQAGEADHVVVAGADVLSKFIVSGFQTLQAMSPEPCRPFDAERKGINLGEAAAAILLTCDRSLLSGSFAIRIAGGGLSNDANHISGPSRTGAELAWAIQQSLNEANVPKEDIDFISAHGTATLYNDEMESKAFALAGIADKPVHSLKGVYGHTLGAAGVLEVALNAEGLTRDCILPSVGFKSLGVSQALNVVAAPRGQQLHVCLKTASGFGGCNAAIILIKEKLSVG